MSIYSGIFPLNIVIFHSYISLPEGTQYPIALRIVTVFFTLGCWYPQEKTIPVAHRKKPNWGWSVTRFTSVPVGTMHI